MDCAIALQRAFAAHEGQRLQVRVGLNAGGGTLLLPWVPGGLEKMFAELSQLTPEAILDPAIRAEVASRHDSIPV